MDAEIGDELLDRHPALTVTGDPRDIVMQLLSRVRPRYANISFQPTPQGQADSDDLPYRLGSRPCL